jgi:hypothetical protein
MKKRQRALAAWRKRRHQRQHRQRGAAPRHGGGMSDIAAVASWHINKRKSMASTKMA